MKVYVVERGCYEERYVAGIYSSVEAALAAHPLPREGVNKGPGSAERPGGWQSTGDGRWSNGLDWDEAESITEMEVDPVSDEGGTSG